jgi:hypothetical protein
MSLCVYAVRCNFLGPPERERLWHEWYDGPKLRQMLALPQFMTMQRFRAAGLDTRRKYLALWLVRSPAAFETPEYRAQWGFAEWTGEIGDWSRDLYDAPDAIDGLLEIGRDERLYLASADGAAAGAVAARLRAARPSVSWIESAGLDRHAPVMGLARLGSGEAPPILKEAALTETLFAPLTERRRAAAS